jgi:FAD/FMN-containing dehydrogenase
MKKKFREALDRKNAQHHATVEAAHEGKISHEHGSSSQKREFRRKSG